MTAGAVPEAFTTGSPTPGTEPGIEETLSRCHLNGMELNYVTLEEPAEVKRH